MSDRPGPYELWRQAGGGTPAYSRQEYHRLMVSHGHLVLRPACICARVVDDPAEHEPACPRLKDNDRRLACGWLPGGEQSPRLTVAVTGDRNWRHPLMLKLTLGGLAVAFLPDFELLIGDCPAGADAQALDLARCATGRCSTPSKPQTASAWSSPSTTTSTTPRAPRTAPTRPSGAASPSTW